MWKSRLKHWQRRVDQRERLFIWLRSLCCYLSLYQLCFKLPCSAIFSYSFLTVKVFGNHCWHTLSNTHAHSLTSPCSYTHTHKATLDSHHLLKSLISLRDTPSQLCVPLPFHCPILWTCVRVCVSTASHSQFSSSSNLVPTVNIR